MIRLPQRLEPSGGWVAGKRITIGRASVIIGPELERAIDVMISTTYAEVKREVEHITADITEHARDEWYQNVTERTGKTGGGIDYEMRLTPSSLKGVVFSRAKETYYVRRPGPFSKLGLRVSDEEFSRVMSQYRANGTIPPGYSVQRWTRTRRAVGVFRINPPAGRIYDGKNLWKVLVTDYSRVLVRERMPEIEKALEVVGKRVNAAA